MIIIWGTKRVSQNLGYAADFCPYCRGFQPAKISRIGTVRHLYYIPSKMTPVREEAVCMTCKGHYTLGDEQVFARFEKRLDLDVDRLLSNTQPDARENYGQRLEIERQVQQNPASLDPEIRKALINESFIAGAAHSHEMGSVAYFDAPLLITLGASVAATVLACFVLVWAKLDAETWFYLPAGVGVVGLLVSIVVGNGSGARRVRKKHLPYLKKALGPLQPTRTELLEFWPSLLGHPLGKALKPDDFIAVR